jgi:hypothetical protein
MMRCNPCYRTCLQWYVFFHHRISQDSQIIKTEFRLKQGTENLGMAMAFTLVSHLRETLSFFVLTRAENRKREERERERKALEVYTNKRASRSV